MPSYNLSARRGLSLDSFVGARALRTTNLTVTAGVWTAIPMDTEVHDTSAIWSAGQATRLVAPSNGYYLITGTVVASGNIFAALTKNGTSPSSDRIVYAGGVDGVTVSATVYLATGEYVELYGYTATTTIFGNSTWARTGIEMTRQAAVSNGHGVMTLGLALTMQSPSTIFY